MANLKPIGNSVPSESTIEQLSNHWLMNLLGPCHSWFYIPTKSEEKLLGYDASLQNYKALAIQYKRLKPNKNIGFITINKDQHSVLINNFPAQGKPYVFYAFSMCEKYTDIRTMFFNGRGIKFCRTMVFFDIHSITARSKYTSISYSYLQKNKIRTYNLFKIAKNFKKCEVGVFYRDIESKDGDSKKSSTRANILVAKIKSA